jgi:hypothetical protein
MRRLAILAVAAMVFGGCMGTPSYVVKHIGVEKDIEGKVTKRVEDEYVIQAASIEDITLEMIKIEKPKPAPVAPSRSLGETNSAGGRW